MQIHEARVNTNKKVALALIFVGSSLVLFAVIKSADQQIIFLPLVLGVIAFVAGRELLHRADDVKI